MIKGSLRKYDTPDIIRMCSRCHHFHELFNLVGKCDLRFYEFNFYGHHMVCDNYDPKHYLPPQIFIQFLLF